MSGIDIEPAFIERARAKLPSAEFWRADMADFDVGVRFDAVICLFNAIGYLTDLARLEAAARCFIHHLSPGGVVVVEPWFTLTPGILEVSICTPAGLTVVTWSE